MPAAAEVAVSQDPVSGFALTMHLRTDPATLVVTSGVDTGPTELPCIAWHILSQILHVHKMFLLCRSRTEGGFYTCGMDVECACKNISSAWQWPSRTLCLW